jgi:histidyl-tRNA synthetase
MGDVTMRDFLETHSLLPASVRITAPTLAILPTDAALNLPAERAAAAFRDAGLSVSVDISDRKIAKKIGAASENGTRYIIVVGEDEERSGTFVLKTLATKQEISGTITDLIAHIS